MTERSRGRRVARAASQTRDAILTSNHHHCDALFSQTTMRTRRRPALQDKTPGNTPQKPKPKSTRTAKPKLIPVVEITTRPRRAAKAKKVEKEKVEQEPVEVEEQEEESKVGRKPISSRRILEAVLWILNTGAQWHMLPQSYPNYKTVHRRFQK